MASEKHAVPLEELRYIRSGILRRVQDEASKDNAISKCVLDLLKCSEQKEQIVTLKKILNDVKEHWNQSKSEQNILGPVQLLTNIYLALNTKHPGKRIIASSFQGYSDDLQSDLVLPQLTAQVIEILQQPIRRNDYCCHGDTRHVVDTLACLLDNFKLGEECLQALCVDSLRYLAEAFEVYLTDYSTNLSPVQQNEIMHHCLVTVQTANRIIQKCYLSLEDKLSAVEAESQELAKHFVALNVQVLRTENLLNDCKSTCGMNIALILKFTCKETAVPIIVQTIFSNILSLKEAPIPVWLVQVDLSQLNVRNISLTSYLCLCHGLLAMLDMEDMAADREDKSCFLLDVLLSEIMDLNARCCDVGSKLLLSKAIFQLTQRTCHFLQSGKAQESFVQRLRGDGDVLQKILNFVWTTWEDTVDVIRLTAKDIFDCIVSIHMLAVTSRLGTIDKDEFLCKLALSICQEVSWSCKGKYNTLSSLVSHLGSRWLLQLHPGIGSEVIDQIQEQTLACYASDLYEKLFTKDLNVDRATWMTTWVDSVVTILCGNSKLQKKLTQEYILPKLLKCGKDTLHYMIQRISSLTEQRKSPDCQLGALIMCLRRARAMGLLKCQSQDQTDMWYGVVEVKLIHGALSSSDDQIRLDAFGLLCENQRTTEPVSEVELRLIEFFIPYNLNSQSPAFRQYFLCHVRKFLSRMSESIIALRREIACKRNTSSVETAADFLKSYKVFLTWLTRTLLSSLYPGSAFGRRTTCLATLSFIIDIFGSSAIVIDKEDLEFDLYGEIQSIEVQTLLECLSDTFEENKQEAVKILVACTQHKTTRIMSNSQMEALFDMALKLSESTKPQDCTTAAYLFRLLLHQDDCHKILQGHMNKENINLALLEIADNNFGKRLLLLWILLKYLQDQRSVAEKNLLIAAANRPLYSTMHCIRYILSDVDYRKIERADEQDWRDFLSALLDECFAVARVVSPVVHNSSPEGNVPVEAIRGPGLDVKALLTEELDIQLMLDAEEVKSTQTVMLMPEYLVVCCWRSIKEISLLLGQISHDVPISDPERTDVTGLIDYQQIVSIGEYFQNQLLESKHRGAFELAYAGFVKMTEMLWKSYISVLHHLPSKWLRKIISDIKSDDPDSRLCATRRSAGIPFYVQALVTTEPTSTGRICFKEAIEELLTLSLGPEGRVDSPANAKVHALNILRALYRDTRLGEDVTPYITDGLKAAILGFKSPLWVVRNSATLLLGAMMTRIFGVKRSKDESSLSRKNCQTGRSFFHRHPVLYQFLLEQITEATQNISEQEKLHLHPALYPVLMVLGRLFPSPVEGADSSFHLAAFIPHIIRCALSPVFKTRVMAARAMQPLVDKDQLTSVFCTLIDLLPKSVETTVIQSHVHGTLLQIKHLLKLVSIVSIATKQDLKQKILPAWRDRLWLITRDNACAVTRKEALEVSERIVSLYTSSDLETHVSLLLDFLFTTLSEEISCIGSLYSFHTPGLSEFYVAVASLYLRLLLSIPRHHKQSITELENSMQTLLNSSEYEVRKVILAVMKEVLQKSKPVIDTDDVSMDADTDDNENLVDHQDFSDFEEKDVVDLIFSSENIYNHLIEMVLHNETHHECLVQLLKVLQLHPLSSHTAISTVLQGQAEQVMMRLLDIIQENSRDEVCAAVIHFSGCLVQTLYDSAAQMFCVQYFIPVRTLTQIEPFYQTHPGFVLVTKLFNAFAKDTTVTYFSCCSDFARYFKYGSAEQEDGGGSGVAMEMWISMLCNHSSTEQSPDIQLACAAVIRQNARILLYNPAQCLGKLNFTVWQILVDLLQEDDLEVKAMASDVLHSLDISITGSVQPFYALDLLIGHFVSYHGNRNMTECMKTLFEWIEDTGDDAYVADSGKRLFDKGEMNTYREDVSFIRLIVKHIRQLLTTIPPITKPHTPSTPTASLQVGVWGDGKFETWDGAISGEEGLQEPPRCREEEDFTAESQPLEQDDEVASESSVFATENFLHSLGSELCGLLRAQGQKLACMSSLESKAAFLNPPGYSRGLIEIYKTLVLVNLGLEAPVGPYCKQECQDVLLLIQDKISSDKFQNDLFISEACCRQ